MDLTKSLLEPLKKNRWIEKISGEYLLPAYTNQSVLNVPAAICKWFEIPAIHANPLRDEITSPLSGNIRRVILLLVDGLSLQQLQRHIQEEKTPVWSRLLRSGLLAPLTSVVPSTTSAAITTFWTGRSPAEHGVVGYELWLKEYGIVTNMITQAPMAFKSGKGSLQQAGFKPETALLVPTLGEHFARHGIQSNSFQHYSIAQSGLSKTFMKNVSMQSFGSHSELWVNLRHLIDKQKHALSYAWVYSGTYDGLAHRYGPDDERAELSFQNFSHSFEHNFLNRLTAEQRDGTLILLTADHGQIYTPQNPHLSLSNHPAFLDALHIKPTGEHRFAYLHIKPGREPFIRAYIEENWPEDFYVYESKMLLESGLLGIGQPDSRTLDRMGDLTLIARNNRYLWWADEENSLLGRHGGITPEEMLVPFLAARL